MTEIVRLMVNFFRNVIRIISFNNYLPLKNTLNIFVRCNTGNTLTVDLDPKCDIKDVKNIIAPKIGANPEELKIIFAGKELDDSIVIEDCDLGQQSMLHAVKSKPRTTLRQFKNQQNSVLNETLTDDEELPALIDKKDKTKAQFYVYCNICHDLKMGKLRVRCSACKSGAITLDTDPKSWEDVLKPHKISGHCEQDDCTDGVFGWAEFYFKCAEHTSKGENDGALPLKQIKNNTRHVPCLACTDVRDMIFVLSCEDAHVTCIDCFRTFIILRLRERQFVLHDELGYTISCPAGCANSYIDDCHYFKLLDKEQYDTYQRFATEEAVLKAGGVLCPQPGCGEGIIADTTCNKVVCANGCGYVFCRNCLQGYHIGDCASFDNIVSSEEIQHVTDPNRASQARWDEATNIAIRVTTKPCPRCRTATERSGGCMHMICTRCAFHWCWVCQTEWSRECMGTHWFG